MTTNLKENKEQLDWVNRMLGNFKGNNLPDGFQDVRERLEQTKERLETECKLIKNISDTAKAQFKDFVARFKINCWLAVKGLPSNIWESKGLEASFMLSILRTIDKLLLAGEYESMAEAYPDLVAEVTACYEANASEVDWIRMLRDETAGYFLSFDELHDWFFTDTSIQSETLIGASGREWAELCMAKALDRELRQKFINLAETMMNR